MWRFPWCVSLAIGHSYMWFTDRKPSTAPGRRREMQTLGSCPRSTPDLPFLPGSAVSQDPDESARTPKSCRSVSGRLGQRHGMLSFLSVVSVAGFHNQSQRCFLLSGESSQAVVPGSILKPLCAYLSYLSNKDAWPLAVCESLDFRVRGHHIGSPRPTHPPPPPLISCETLGRSLI